MRMCIVVAALIISPSFCVADLVISVGSSTISEGTSSVVIPITVTGTPSILSAAISFAVTKSSTPSLADQNVTFTNVGNVAFLDGTVFDDNPGIGVLGGGYSVAISPGSLGTTSHKLFDILGGSAVSPNGLLFNVTINTSALVAGTYSLVHNFNGVSEYVDFTGLNTVDFTSSQGTLIVQASSVPEPGFALFALVAAGGMGYRRLRRKESELVA